MIPVSSFSPARPRQRHKLGNLGVLASVDWNWQNESLFLGVGKTSLLLYELKQEHDDKGVISLGSDSVRFSPLKRWEFFSRPLTFTLDSCIWIYRCLKHIKLMELQFELYTYARCVHPPASDPRNLHFSYSQFTLYNLFSGTRQVKRYVSYQRSAASSIFHFFRLYERFSIFHIFLSRN